jgi:predicted transcriptional regulator
MKGALPKPTLLELDEYDINQRLVEALTTTCSHAILFSIVDKEKDAVQISGQLQISLSSVYKTLTNLEKLSLVEIQRFHINTDNKKIKMYRSKISSAEITINENKSEVKLQPNTYQNQ